MSGGRSVFRCSESVNVTGGGLCGMSTGHHIAGETKLDGVGGVGGKAFGICRSAFIGTDLAAGDKSRDGLRS